MFSVIFLIGLLVCEFALFICHLKLWQSNIVSMDGRSNCHHSSFNRFSSKSEEHHINIVSFFTTRQRTSMDWLCASVLGSIKCWLWFTILCVNPCLFDVPYALHWSLWIKISATDDAVFYFITSQIWNYRFLHFITVCFFK